jgi:hypothetical protein
MCDGQLGRVPRTMPWPVVLDTTGQKPVVAAGARAVGGVHRLTL